MCGHSLEVNVTTSLDFYLSVAQVQLLQQLLRDNIVGLDAPEKRAEVHNVIQNISTHPTLLQTTFSFLLTIIFVLILFMYIELCDFVSTSIMTSNSTLAVTPDCFFVILSHLNIYSLRA